MRPRIWPIVLATAIGVAILVSLGVWQVQRLAWKNALSAETDKRVAVEPVSISKLIQEKPDLLGESTFAKVKMAGSFRPTQLRKITTLNGVVGFEILQGLVDTNDVEILVSRGVLPEQTTASTPDKPVEVIGLLRSHNILQGRFDPDNKPVDNQWYWWDVPAMYVAAGLKATDHTTLVLHLLPGSPGTEGLFVEQPKANLRNNHLGYAITWFGLAAVLVVMSGLFIYRSRHPGESRDLSNP